MKITKIRLIIFFILLIILIPTGITFSRYVQEVVGDYILESKRFYFSSDKLRKNNTVYQINNWSGVGSFSIQFNLNNKKNNILHAESDISYNVTTDCGVDAICSFNNLEGVIYTTEGEDNYNLIVTPTRAFLDNEELIVNVKASSKEPYLKTLSATFIIKVGKRGISYEINDKVNNPYLNFTITNAINSYKVREAFLNYVVGDEISIETYLSLSSVNKSKCASQIVTLSFDPNLVILDTTTDIMKYSTKTYTNISGVDYINSITFKVEAVSSNIIRFYKKNPNLNYTYPFENNNSVITFNAY